MKVTACSKCANVDGRLFTIDADGGNGLRKINQLHVLPGGQVSLAVLGWGQDAHGEVYVLGNVSGVPFPAPGTMGDPTGHVLKLVRAPKTDDDKDKDKDKDKDDD